MGNNAILATNVTLYAKINFDPVKDFDPISLVGTQANVLVVNDNLPVHSLAELIALAKAEPGKLNFASSGFGLAAHLAGELFKTMAHVDIVHVPYKGSAPALEDVISGEDQMMFATTSGAMGFIKNEQVRPLAVTTLKRSSILPDVPTIDELGVNGFEATTWHGLVAPAGTPKPDHRHAASRRGRGDEGSRRAAEARRPRRRDRAGHAGRVLGLYQGRNSEMGGGDQGLRARSWSRTAPRLAGDRAIARWKASAPLRSGAIRRMCG